MDMLHPLSISKSSDVQQVQPIAVPLRQVRFASLHEDEMITTDPEDLAYNNLVKAARRGEPDAIAQMEHTQSTVSNWLGSILGPEANAAPQLDWKTQRTMYRLIDEAELTRLLSGERVNSDRSTHGGFRTDITDNPNYAKVGREGKYRVTFKPKDKFDPVLRAEPNRPHTEEKNATEREYYLVGGYTLQDVARIERYKDGDWTEYRRFA